jgi:uncharacterized protein
MYLVDVNVLVYAQHSSLPQHAASRAWLDRNLAGHPQSVALPWPVLLGFVRLVTNPKVFPGGALCVADAWRQAQRWMDAPAAWTPVPGPRHRWFLTNLIDATKPTNKKVPDLHLAALALENGLSVASVDADFGLLPGIRWVDPLQTA